MIFMHIKLIQEGEAALFYKFDRTLNGYLIAGLLVAPNTPAKMAFAKIWTYFVSEIVKEDDIYCSMVAGAENTLFANYLTYYSEINGLSIYKVDNFLKDQYSSYARNVEGRTGG
jgi:hypothetical protein